MFHFHPDIIHATDFHRIEAMTIERRTVAVEPSTTENEGATTEAEEGSTTETTLETQAETTISVLHLTVELKDNREYSDIPQRLFVNAMPPLILAVEPPQETAGDTEPLPEGETSSDANASSSASAPASEEPPASTTKASNGNGKKSTSGAGFNVPVAPSAPEAPNGTGTPASNG